MSNSSDRHGDQREGGDGKRDRPTLADSWPSTAAPIPIGAKGRGAGRGDPAITSHRLSPPSLAARRRPRERRRRELRGLGHDRTPRSAICHRPSSKLSPLYGRDNRWHSKQLRPSNPLSMEPGPTQTGPARARATRSVGAASATSLARSRSSAASRRWTRRRSERSACRWGLGKRSALPPRRPIARRDRRRGRRIDAGRQRAGQEWAEPGSASVMWLTMRGIELASGGPEPVPLRAILHLVEAPVLPIASNRPDERAIDEAFTAQIPHATLWYLPDVGHAGGLGSHPERTRPARPPSSARRSHQRR
jgi:hypothetical protein